MSDIIVNIRELHPSGIYNLSKNFAVVKEIKNPYEHPSRSYIKNRIRAVCEAALQNEDTSRYDPLKGPFTSNVIDNVVEIIGRETEKRSDTDLVIVPEDIRFAKVAFLKRPSVPQYGNFNFGFLLHYGSYSVREEEFGILMPSGYDAKSVPALIVANNQPGSILKNLKIMAHAINYGFERLVHNHATSAN